MCWVASVLLLCSGCTESKPWNETPAGNEGMAAAAVALTLSMTGDSPAPQPGPKPAPSGDCTNCDGTGRLPGDGRIRPLCPVCGGDGKVDAMPKPWRSEVESSVSSALEQYQAEVQQQIEQATADDPEIVQRLQDNLERTEETSRRLDELSQTDPVWLTDWLEAYELAKTTGKPILAHLGGPNCQPCVAMEPWMDRDEVRRRLDWCVPVKLDAEAAWDDKRTVAEGFTVRKIPCDVVVRVSKTDSKRVGGAVPPTPTAGKTFYEYLRYLETLKEKFK